MGDGNPPTVCGISRRISGSGSATWHIAYSSSSQYQVRARVTGLLHLSDDLPRWDGTLSRGSAMGPHIRTREQAALQEPPSLLLCLS